MTKHTNNHDLSFLSASVIEDNLATALSSIGQSLKHQKLQEVAARVQGFPSLNHRCEPQLARDSVTLLLSELNETTQLDMVALEVTYLLVTFTWEDFKKMKAAVAMAKLLDRWATVSLPLGTITGYGEPDDGLCLDDVAAAAALLESQEDEARVRLAWSEVTLSTEDIHRTPNGELCINGSEKHGFSFSCLTLSLDVIEQAFVTGDMESRHGWHLVPAQ